MKELIVTVGFILLGCILFDMIAGDDDSLRTVSGRKMETLMEWYREEM